MYSLTAQHKNEMPIHYSARYEYSFDAHYAAFDIIRIYSQTLRKTVTTINWLLGDDDATGYINVYFGDPPLYTYWIQFAIDEVDE